MIKNTSNGANMIPKETKTPPKELSLLTWSRTMLGVFNQQQSTKNSLLHSYHRANQYHKTTHSAFQLDCDNQPKLPCSSHPNHYKTNQPFKTTGEAWYDRMNGQITGKDTPHITQMWVCCNEQSVYIYVYMWKQATKNINNYHQTSWLALIAMGAECLHIS